MYGAILGDIIGSPYEFDMGRKIKNFPLFSENSYFTDDTVMTIAVAEAFTDAPDDETIIRKRLINSMQKWGALLPRCRLWCALPRLVRKQRSSTLWEVLERFDSMITCDSSDR